MNRRFCLLFALLVPAAVRAEAPPPSAVKVEFLKLLDRPKVPLDPSVRSQIRGEGLMTERLDFATEKQADGTIERVPTLLVRPETPQGRLPAVIVLHGTGGNKEGSRGWLEDLAKRGIIGVAIDGRYHGERAGGAKGAEAYLAAITAAWKTKPDEPQPHPFYYDTCWDIWRTIDYLQTRDDIDPERIGMIGFSKGGIETWLAAAVDDRVKVAIPAIGVQSFQWSLENDRWQGRARTIGAAHEAAARTLGEPKVNARVCRELWNKIIPGILGPYDCPSMIRLFAGRPLMILNGELDPNCPIEGAEVAFAAARAAYAKAGAEDKLKILVAKGVGHTVTDDQRRAALEWFERWLRPGSP